MWGLEYLLLFGLSENKLEVFDGKTRLVFPFLDRADAVAHFNAWREALARWQAAEATTVVEQADRCETEVSGLTLTLYPLPIELRVPIDVDTLITLQGAFWQRDFWDAQPTGSPAGRDSPFDHSDVVLNLWRFFESVEDQVGGKHCGRVGMILPGVAAVEPDHYYFAPDHKPRMIRGEFVWDTPELLVEVLSPANRALDHSTRMELYGRAGVPHLWLLDPLSETLEVYQLDGSRFVLVSTARIGDTYRHPLFPTVELTVADLFNTQRKRHPDWVSEGDDAIPAWLIPPGRRLGLEYLLIVGHPERRYEVWGDRAPCVLAFGSEDEAQERLRHFAEDACRWEGMPPVQPKAIEPGEEVVEVGRFHFTRRGRLIHLEVAVELELYRHLLEAWATREAWDWGEEDLPPLIGL